MHVDTFQPRNGTQTSVLLLQKKDEKTINQEEKMRKMKDYNIFMSIVDRVGHDKRGNTLFKRDKYGNEILIQETNNIDIFGGESSGESFKKELSKTKVIDDQTVNVHKIFTKWKKQEGITW